ncbi:MAG: UDP-N-acetylmuramate dehydrogenase [Cyanobacteria bacterium P01_F01_bin.153]
MVTDLGVFEKQLRSQVSLAKSTTFRVGGPAEWYMEPDSLDSLEMAIAWADKQSVPITPLGAGSNLLVSDRGIDGLVIATRNLRQVTVDHERLQITATAGTPLPLISWKAASLGWTGMEWAVGIPGTVGGAVVMNAGAHGGDTARSLAQVRLLNLETNSLRQALPEELGYAYRTSNLQGSHQMVTEATFQLAMGESVEAVRTVTKEQLSRRHATQPYRLPNCGSVFRNPEPRKAARLIEEAGLKGFQVGGAQVAHLHANFIVNIDQATAWDISSLINRVRETVYEKWDVMLHTEVKMLGQFPVAA